MLSARQRAAGAAAAARRSLPPLDVYLKAGEERGILWTALRREVLELLWREGGPWGPYGLADAMRETGHGVYPNSVYRVLNILSDAGLIVTIASSRRVQIVPDPDQRDWAVLQCMDCAGLELVPFTPVADLARSAASHLGHATQHLVIECVGQCRSCSAALADR